MVIWDGQPGLSTQRQLRRVGIRGRFHEKPVGPHPRFSYQVAFRNDQLAPLLSWLTLNRGDLTVFIHPNTGHDLEDHRDRAIWMGQQVPLILDIFKKKD